MSTGRKLKRRVTLDGAESLLELQIEHGEAVFTLHGAIEAEGKASIAEIAPGVFSVLLGAASFTTHVLRQGSALEITVGHSRYSVEVVDPRDRPSDARQHAASGPVEIRAQMPGKVVKILVEHGAAVAAGQSLLVVEAMKMQNEVKAQREGVAGKIYVAEGATVVAGEKLMLIE